MPMGQPLDHGIGGLAPGMCHPGAADLASGAVAVEHDDGVDPRLRHVSGDLADQELAGALVVVARSAQMADVVAVDDVELSRHRAAAPPRTGTRPPPSRRSAT